jgi:hypothetical protein
MFDDLFHIVASLDYDYHTERGERVHSYSCRRCAIAMRLNRLKDLVERMGVELG